MKHLISQNIDGLHLRSGVSRENISELHGNTYLETCADCGKGHMRDYRTRDDINEFNVHLTGRYCDACGGPLNDSIINFGEKLPHAEIESA
jgi:NAD-dependent SIR2 family protein deacetylase